MRASIPPDTRTTVVVVTGLSGAGKSTALHALEDLGFYCIDNLPTALAAQAVLSCEAGGMRRVALGIDVRVRSFLGAAGPVLDDLRGGGTRELQVVFLDAADEVLLRRFGETRRPHPLDLQSSRRGKALVLLDELHQERSDLTGLRAHATRVIDTSALSVHELRRVVVGHFGPQSGGALRMSTRIMSFGFKYGPPVDADLVFDARFLKNPYFVPALKPLTGLDAPVAAFVLEQPEAVTFLEKMQDLLTFTLPRYEREGKSYLTVAVGCTGGRHRSVALVEALGARLGPQISSPVTLVHRDASRKEEVAAATAPVSR